MLAGDRWRWNQRMKGVAAGLAVLVQTIVAAAGGEDEITAERILDSLPTYQDAELDG